MIFSYIVCVCFRRLIPSACILYRYQIYIYIYTYIYVYIYFYFYADERVLVQVLLRRFLLLLRFRLCQGFVKAPLRLSQQLLLRETIPSSSGVHHCQESIDRALMEP